MKNLLRIVLLSMFIAGCAAFNQYTTNTANVVTAEKGATEAEAVERNLKRAINIATNTYLYSEEEITQGKLEKDNINIYNAGIVKDYNILSKVEEGNEVLVTVESNIILDALKQQDLASYKEIDKQMEAHRQVAVSQQVEGIQAKLKEGENIKNKLVGDKNTFFKKAYRTYIKGYRITMITDEKVAGYYLVHLQLDNAFWDRYFSVLSLLEVEQKSTVEKILAGVEDITKPMFKVPIPVTTRGIYGASYNKNGTYCTAEHEEEVHYVPEKVGILPTIGISFAYPEKNYEGELRHNEISLNLKENKMDLSLSFSDDNRSSSWIGNLKAEDSIIFIYNELCGGDELIIDRYKGVTLKVAFVTRNLREFLLSNSIPWEVSVVDE